MTFPIGGQTIGIVKASAVLDDNGNPVVSELFEPEMTQSVVWKSDCLFEVQLPAATFVKQAEDVTATVTTSKRVAWCLMPADADTTALQPDVCSLRSDEPPDIDGNPLDYIVREVVVESDINGVANHVFVFCEWQGG